MRTFLSGAILVTLCVSLLAQEPGRTGSICVLSVTDPTPGDKSLYNYAGGNPPADYSVQIGKGNILPIPHSAKGNGPGMLITGIPVDGSYLARIRHQGNPIESFRFKFADEDRGTLCLFMNEFYLTWQLRPAASYPPRCKCNGATIAPLP